MKIENLDLESLEALALQLHDERANFLHTLVDLRKQSGLTQKDVAERIGVTQPTVAEFEHYDANPRLDTILRYALAVNACLNLRAYDANAFSTGWTQVAQARHTPTMTPTNPTPRAWKREAASAA